MLILVLKPLVLYLALMFILTVSYLPGKTSWLWLPDKLNYNRQVSLMKQHCY